MAEARRHVAECLISAGHPEAIDAAALVTSEVVTNAIRHGTGDLLHSGVTVAVWCQATQVHIDVLDTSDSAPCLRQASDTAQCGRGLLLVEAVATRWGYDHADPGPGKRVWAEVAYGEAA
ncbi:ATP-binding protein [Streptomyces zagrosensis]|uniref:Anti-sigma regulatory factor (Ser/Thr protein kinase) n=1 Tax=Streptomyces zagrosensis TaxID=1042984 RepID=A0A7W9QBQ5_9ACTN|nr:ATP-binding protein [Streptomyces zagrosensis]MBB5937234.1 anti-sigma regulatory factor (Ser/Thr protein kinase) [Streptomyces zagrosensis]